MYRKILIPVDGSDVSNHAAEEGLKLARILGSWVIFQYVIDTSVITLPESELGISNIEAISRSFREHGEKIFKSVEALAATHGVNAQTVMSEGDVHNEIIALAEDRNIELIIMGTHGRLGLKRLLLGSVAESVSKHAHCAVLLIRPD